MEVISGVAPVARFTGSLLSLLVWKGLFLFLTRRGRLNAEEEQLSGLQETDPLALFSNRRCRTNWTRDEQTGPRASTSWPSTQTRWRRSWSKWPVTWGGPALRSCTFQSGGQITVACVSGVCENRWADTQVCVCYVWWMWVVKKEGSDNMHAGRWINHPRL